MADKMMKVLEQSKDEHVRTVVVFAKAEDSKLYVDNEFTTQLKEADLNELFIKGLLLICTDEENSVYEKAVKVSANKAYTMGTVSSAVAFVEWAAEAAA